MKIFGYELKLTKVKQKKTGYSSKRWTPSETDTALRMRNEGQSTAKIAKRLNRSIASINARIWKVRKK